MQRMIRGRNGGAHVLSVATRKCVPLANEHYPKEKNHHSPSERLSTVPVNFPSFPSRQKSGNIIVSTFHDGTTVYGNLGKVPGQ